MALDPIKVSAEATDWTQREQYAFDQLKALIATHPITKAYAEVLACRAMRQQRLGAASTAGITLTGVPTEPTLPTASLTAASDASGAPSLLSVIAAVITSAVTDREALESSTPAYQDRTASS